VENGDSEALEELLKEGVSSNYVDDDGNTATMKAAEGEVACLEVLLSHGTDVLINHADNEGNTALMKAVSYGDAECVKLLLDSGADKTLQNKLSQTAVTMAEEEGNDEVIGILDPSKAGKEREPLPPPPPSEGGGAAPGRRRGSVSSESYNKNAKVDLSKIPVIPKTDEQKAEIQTIIKNNILFKALDKNALAQIIDAMDEKSVKAGEFVIKQHEAGDFYYVVSKGAFDCYVEEAGHEAPGKQVMHYEKGTAFGELALMYNAPRAASVKAATDATLWTVEREAFRTLILQVMIVKRERLEASLRKIEMLAELNVAVIGQLADSIEDVYFTKGDIIITEGDQGSDFFFLLEGTTIATQVPSGGGAKVTVLEYKAGDYFGELAVLAPNSGRRRATIEVTSDDCHCVSISEAVFARLLGSFRQRMMKHAETYQAHV